MTLRDRGTKKWTSMMLPEHVRELKKSLIDEKRIAKPILDEQKIELMEEIVHSAIENDDPLLFSIYIDGFINKISGKVTFIDHIQKQFKITDDAGYKRSIFFKDVTNIEKSELS